MSGTIHNTVYFVDGRLVQFDEFIAQNPVQPGPSPVPPVPVPPTPEDDPIEQLHIVLSIDGGYMQLAVTGNTSSLDHYEVSAYVGGERVKTFDNGKSTTFELSRLDGGVPVGDCTMDCVAVSTFGNTSPASDAIEYTVLPAPEAMTLRFEFSKNDYDPVAAGVGSSGTWKKLNTKDQNVWDWTNENTDWHESFRGAFHDSDNEVSVIAAGDTSSVTNMRAIFGGEQNQDSTIKTPSYLKSICLIDTSNVTNAYGMFSCCPMLEEVPLFNLSNATDTRYMFFNCQSLKSVPLFDLSSATKVDCMFHRCYSLKEVPSFNLSTASNTDAMFSMCTSLEELPDFDTSSATSLTGMFNAMPSLKEMPSIDLSSATTIQLICGAGSPEFYPLSLETIPDLSSVTSALTNCSGAFKNAKNCKYGILEAYQALSVVNPANHSDCFLNCGIDTEEGRAALAQIPQSWGGLAEG